MGSFFDVLEFETDKMAQNQLNISISFIQKLTTKQSSITNRPETNLNGIYCIHFISLIHNDSVKGSIFRPIEHARKNNLNNTYVKSHINYRNNALKAGKLRVTYVENFGAKTKFTGVEVIHSSALKAGIHKAGAFNRISSPSW